MSIAVATSQFWIHHAVAAVIKQVTGLPVSIQRSHVNLAATEFGIYGIEIKNPKGFSEEVFVKIPEIYIDFDLNQFLSGKKIHFEEIRLNIEQVTLEKNKAGELNVSRLKTVKKDQKEAAAPAKTPQKPMTPLLIDQLVLTIRNIKYVDQSLPVSVNRNVDLKIENEIIKGVTNPADIVRLVMSKIIYNSTFGALGAPVDLLNKNLDASLAKGQAALTQSTDIALQMGNQVMGEGKKMVQDATSMIPSEIPGSKEVGQLKDQVKGKAGGLFQGAERLLKNTTESIQETVGEKQDQTQSTATS